MESNQGHEYIMLTQTRVEVLFTETGNPIIIVDPDEVKKAQLRAVYGCQRCELTVAEVSNTPCPGE